MARLTYRKRKSLPRASFALPEARKYPLDTPNRARNALSRGAQFATPAQQATIKKAVHKKYPNIAVGGVKPSKRGTAKRQTKSRSARAYGMPSRNSMRGMATMGGSAMSRMRH